MQEKPMAERLHAQANALFHRFHQMTEDDVICELEQEEVLDALDAVQMLAEMVSESQALGIARIRLGPDSQRVGRLERAFERKYGHVA